MKIKIGMIFKEIWADNGGDFIQIIKYDVYVKEFNDNRWKYVVLTGRDFGNQYGAWEGSLNNVRCYKRIEGKRD